MLGKKRKLLIILCVAFAVRSIQLLLICTISGDGPIYIEMAKDFFAGNFKAGLAKDYPPLYPLFIAAVYSITRDWLVAGYFVSLLFSFFTILLIYFLVKDVFGETIACITAVLLIFQPVVGGYSVRIITEPTYIFFFVLSVYLSWKAITKQKYSLYFWAGSVSGLSYLVRPEGLGIVIVTGLYTLLQAFSDFKDTYKKRIISICTLALGTMVLVSPYVLYIRSETGKWQLSKKKSIIAAVTGQAIGDTVPDTSLPREARMLSYSRIGGRGYLRTLFGLVVEFVKAYNLFLFLLLFLGLIRRKLIPRRPKYESFVFLVLIFHILIFALFYVTPKYIISLISISLFWASIGFYELYEAILTKIPLQRIKAMPKLPNRIFAVLLSLIILDLLPCTLRPQDRDKIGKKKVGLWIKENCIKSPWILTDSLRLAFYAEANAVRFQNRPGISRYRDLIKFVKSSNDKIDYVVVDKATIRRYCSDFLDSVDSSDLEIIHVQPKLSHSHYGELIVYKVK